MQKIIIIIVLCLLGIFVHPFDPGIMDFIYRFIIFAVIIFLVYTSLQTTEAAPGYDPEIQHPADPVPPPSYNDPFISDNKMPLTSVLRKDDRTKTFLKDQFDLLSNLIFPDFGWIFFKKNEELVCFHMKAFSETKIDRLPERLTVSGLIKILDEKDDIVIENSLDETKGLLNYYQDIDYHPQSFLGLPVLLPDNEKLFFVFDSHHAAHFNIEDSSILTNVIKNTGIWLQTRIKAYDILAELNFQKKLVEFVRLLNQSKSISAALEQFTLLVSQEFEASRLTISFVQKNKDLAVIKKVVGQQDEFAENIEFPLDEGLTGWVISKDKPYLIEDMEKGEYFIPRYNKSEKSNFGLRSFLGIPLTAAERTVGAITLEHRAASKYHETDKTRLNQYASLFSSTFNRTLSR